MESHTDITNAEKTETLEITAHIDSQTWFCTVDDDRLMCDHIVEIEEKFGRADEEQRVISELILESEREEPAPVVGTVRHAEGELLDINIDLSDWYGDE
jgi:hypothetical protein